MNIATAASAIARSRSAAGDSIGIASTAFVVAVLVLLAGVVSFAAVTVATFVTGPFAAGSRWNV
jgi:hypothetical protein